MDKGVPSDLLYGAQASEGHGQQDESNVDREGDWRGVGKLLEPIPCMTLSAAAESWHCLLSLLPAF